MTMIKRGTISSTMIVASSVWICPICGYSEINKAENNDCNSSKSCPHDEGSMQLISSSWGARESSNS